MGPDFPYANRVCSTRKGSINFVFSILFSISEIKGLSPDDDLRPNTRIYKGRMSVKMSNIRAMIGR